MRRLCAGIAALVLLAPATLLPQAQRAVTQPPSPSAKPNIVIMILDDAGYGDFGVYGGEDIKTPSIDGIARDGVRLTDFYANGMLCSATRAGLISGRYQQRYVIEGALGSTEMTPGLPVEGRSLPQLLKNSGYATALVGKWHLGGIPENRPLAHGFDHFFGFLGSHIDYYHHNRGEMQPDLWENGTRIYPALDGQYMTDLINENSLRFLEQSAVSKQPFFLEVAFNAPHWPYQPPGHPSPPPGTGAQQLPNQDDTATRSDYKAMVEAVDTSIGQILKALDRLDVAQNTLVVVTNDHGGEWLSDPGALFHRKWTIWEGGIRVPLLIRWPGHLQAGRISDQVGITMDLSASVLAAAGVPIPSQYEGMNLLPILEGQAPEIDRTLFWRMTPRQQKAVRSGDWKLMVDSDHEMLFNLRTDVGERHDVARNHPEIVQRLRPLIAKWEADVDAEAAVNVPPGSRGAPGGGGAGGGRGGAPAPGGGGRGGVPAPGGRGGGAPATPGRGGNAPAAFPLARTINGFDTSDRFFNQFFIVDPATGNLRAID